MKTPRCNEMVELVALRRVAPRSNGATILLQPANYAASRCPLRGQKLSQRDNFHQCLFGRSRY